VGPRIDWMTYQGLRYALDRRDCRLAICARGTSRGARNVPGPCGLPACWGVDDFVSGARGGCDARQWQRAGLPASPLAARTRGTAIPRPAPALDPLARLRGPLVQPGQAAPRAAADRRPDVGKLRGSRADLRARRRCVRAAGRCAAPTLSASVEATRQREGCLMAVQSAAVGTVSPEDLHGRCARLQ
jgi:hypothetical protein